MRSGGHTRDVYRNLYSFIHYFKLGTADHLTL